MSDKSHRYIADDNICIVRRLGCYSTAAANNTESRSITSQTHYRRVKQLTLNQEKVKICFLSKYMEVERRIKPNHIAKTAAEYSNTRLSVDKFFLLVNINFSVL